ncbi:MAG: histidinol-phosphatase HisJ family protein [Pirellulales bacterium]|nr:histidinol-phosphatase HisJ family protein [Pirellulales bacterium]
MARLLYETHSHTPLCKHAVGLPEEYAAVAEARGLRGIVITCHNPMPDGFAPHVRMDLNEFGKYLDMVARAREAWDGRVDVRLGLEADYFAGFEPWLEKQLASSDFHYVLGSVHPQIAEFRQQYWREDPVEVQRIYFQLLADAAETQLFDSMAHPDLIKNETPHHWRPAQIMDEIRRCLDRVAAVGVAMELNTSGVNKVVSEMNPFPEMLVEIASREIPVVIGSDAHNPGRVADGFQQGLDLLSECGFTQVSYFVNRVRHDVDIDSARASLGGPTLERPDEMSG